MMTVAIHLHIYNITMGVCEVHTGKLHSEKGQPNSDFLVTFVTTTAPWSPAGLQVRDLGIQGNSRVRSLPCHKI